MLNMGFVEDIETILNAAKDNDDLQTLLFSATLPKWVADIARRFLTAGHARVDLVGDEKRASDSVTHMLMPCQWSERTELVCDLIRAKVPGDAHRLLRHQARLRRALRGAAAPSSRRAPRRCTAT